METKAIKSIITKAVGRTVIGFASISGVKDAGGDIVVKGAFTKTIKERFQRVRHLWQHRYDLVPTATIVSLKEVSRKALPQELRDDWDDATGGLQVERDYLTTTHGQELLAALTSDPPAINEMSIGFDPVTVKFEEAEDGCMIRLIKEARLWDTSDVNWGMNEATVAQKSAIPYKQTPMAGEAELWDFAKEREKSSPEDLKIMAAFHCQQGHNYTLLHHHKADGYPVSLKGVKQAMKVLFFGSWEPGLSVDERKVAHGHLAEHYKQFEKAPPCFEVLELAYQGNRLINQGVDEKTISPLIGYAEKLIAAEPAEAPLTGQKRLAGIKARLEIASREL